MVKVLNRDAINRMVNKNSPSGGSSSNGNVTTVNRSRSQQEQTRKGPDTETRLKYLEELTAKLEERVSELEERVSELESLQNKK
jgi:hypothetical protein